MAKKNSSIVNRNISKVSRLKFEDVIYDLFISFNLSSYADLNKPEDWIRANKKKYLPSVRSIDSIFCGTGFSLITGDRDYHFQGTKEQMKEVANAFAHSEFIISGIASSLDEACD